jgi:hypothetical protein
VCLDGYEASAWRVPDPTTTNATLVRKIRLGRATEADLTAGGAPQLGVTVAYAPCAPNGQNCADDIYTVRLNEPSRRGAAGAHILPLREGTQGSSAVANASAG